MLRVARAEGAPHHSLLGRDCSCFLRNFIVSLACNAYFLMNWPLCWSNWQGCFLTLDLRGSQTA